MTTVAELKASGQVWSLHDDSPNGTLLSTGFAELDQLLVGGFPAHTVVEIHSDFGIGEFRLLLPCITNVLQTQLLVMINPPFQIVGQMLFAAGIPCEQVLILRPATSLDALWAAEQCLKSACCGFVILWQSQLSIGQLKRLQLCAQTGQATLFMFRDQRQHQLSLPVALSLQLTPDCRGIYVQVLKRRGGWPQAPVLVDMTGRWPRLSIQSPTVAPQILSHSA